MHFRRRLIFAFLPGLVMCMGCSGESDEGTGAGVATATTDSTTDIARLQGRWNAVSSVSGGVEFDAATISHFTMTVTDDVMVFDYSE